MTVYVADHSFSFVPSAQLKAAGYSGDIGYCSFDPRKNWTPAQIKDRLAAGLQCGLVWETTAQRASVSGAQGGTSDGHAYLGQATALGATGGTLWACLEDPTVLPVSAWPNVVAYAAAMAVVLTPAGFSFGGYGSDRLLSHVLAAGSITRKWAVETWPRGTWNPDLIQLANSHPLNTFNGAVDCNIAVADWGHTLFFGATAPTIGGSFMSDLNPLQQQQIATAILANVTTATSGVAWSVNDIENTKIPAITAALSALSAMVAHLVAVPPGTVTLSAAQVSAIAEQVVALIGADLKTAGT